MSTYKRKNDKTEVFVVTDLEDNSVYVFKSKKGCADFVMVSEKTIHNYWNKTKKNYIVVKKYLIQKTDLQK